MAMFNETKNFLDTSNSQSMHANILTGRHFPSTQYHNITSITQYQFFLAKILQE